MCINETFENFANAKDDLAIMLFGKQLIEEIETVVESSSEKLLESKDLGKYEVEGCNKLLTILMKKSSAIDSKVIDELSEEEIRKTYKVTEKSLKDLNRKDLLEKYKTVTEVKSMKVESIKG